MTSCHDDVLPRAQERNRLTMLRSAGLTHWRYPKQARMQARARQSQLSGGAVQNAAPANRDGDRQYGNGGEAGALPPQFLAGSKAIRPDR